MSCDNCKDLGYIEYPYSSGGRIELNVMVCPVCRQYSKYSKHLHELYSKAFITQVDKVREELIKVDKDLPDNVIEVDFVNKRRVL